MAEYNIKCTLCKSGEINPIHNKIRNITDDSSKMYECTTCGTHFLYPQPKDEELEDYYDGQFREEVHTSLYYDKAELNKVFNKFTFEANRRVARIENELQLSDEILEIGCSVGYFLDAIACKVNAVYGTEWDSRARLYIDEVIHNPKIKTSKNPQDFSKQFDKIFMFHVLEHIVDPVQFLVDLKPLLKEGGKLYIEVPNVDDILVKTFRCDAFKDYYYKKAHIYNFNEKSLQYIFNQSGYEYDIRFIQRYDISNHFYWLANGKPGGRGFYQNILSNQVNEEYVKSLVMAKQTDTLFAVIQAN
ncbi:MAG: methyltransferase, type 11 [Herbinix sp.]|jgi:2-polyprenyl-3-methyl-5-hydroxy-6-metoxy-1,4-benzoquinol methylase|nr:methyltransferase, type 11 [Herbinix sp.]